jgi:hypothetical protein
MAVRPSAVAALKFIEHWSHHTAIRAHCIHADRNDDLTFSHSTDLTIVSWPETAVRHLHVASLRIRARRSWLFLFGDFSLIGLGAPFPLSHELPLLGERSFDPLFALPDGPHMVLSSNLSKSRGAIWPILANANSEDLS